MAGLFSTGDRGSGGAVDSPMPPPPGRPGARPPAPVAPAEPVAVARPGGLGFDAELDLCELDDRERPGPTWSARGKNLSRAAMSFRSRRMCYIGRRILAAVHLIDAEPVPLFGRVRACEYDGQGMYLVELELLPVPEHPEVVAWMKARGK